MKTWHVLVGVATIIGVLITFQITIESYQNRLFQAELAPIREQVYNHLPTSIQDVKNELKSDIQDVRNELKRDINSINTKLDQLIIHLIPRSQLTETGSDE